MNDQQGPAHVVITGVDMSFGALVNLMIKLAIASIPAGIIISIIYLIFFLIFSGILAGCGYTLGLY
jgi:hypothetical protein